MLGISKRRLCYETDTNDCNSPKRLSDISRSGTPHSPSKNFDSPYYTEDITDTTMTEERNADNEKICYGTICDVLISLCSNAKVRRNTRPWDRYYLFNVQVGSGACCLLPDLDVKTKQRSRLDGNTVATLTLVSSKVRHVFFAAAIGVNALYGKRRKSSKPIVQATVNIYGPKHLMDEVDEALSTISTSLQHPLFLEPNISYINPQFLYPGPGKTDLRHLIGQTSKDTTSGLSQVVDGVMGCLNYCSEDQESSISLFQLIFDQYLVETELKEYL
ncbi:hypothetical protein FVEN_g6502 [Fusarium venenatum]|nr:hypothetical protein FVEN_g6502 [Fusarium venenatum]